MSDINDIDPDELFSAQTGLQKQLQSAHSNFKKSPKERLSWNYIKTKLDLLETYWASFQENHKRILQSTNKKLLENEFYLNMYFETEDEYAVAKDNMLTKLSNFVTPSVPNSNPVKTESSVQHIKLPPIRIPSFDGQYSEWTSFHDQFLSLVHLNTSLSNVNKLHLLKQNLVGEAANLLKNISITDNNYEHAWNKLKKRYSNKRVIINTYLQKLMSLRNIPTENANAIKNLLDTATDCLCGLQGMGIDTKTWDPIIIYLITSKLDSESIKHWEEIVSKEFDEDNPMPTYKQFTEFLEMRFRSLEGVQSSRNNLRGAMPKTIPERKVFHNTPKEGCAVCGGEHYIFKCRQFSQMSVPERKTFIESKNLCFNCLIPNHGVKTCRQQSRCRICGKRHHSLIHVDTNYNPPRNEREDPKHPENKETKHPEIKDTKYQEEKPKNTKEIKDNNLSNHHAMNSAEQRPTNILLATALVKVTADNGRTLQLRALIDQGSEGTFITEHAAQNLGLKRTTTKQCTISGLGNNTVSQTKYSVSFTLQSDYDTSLQLPVNAYVLTTLTRLLPSRQVITTWKHLHGLTLADPDYGEPAKIDLLLGADVYSRILLDGVVSGSIGSPLAQRTRFGWVLSGGVYTTDTTNLSSQMINMHVTTHNEEMEQLQKFWELESATTYKTKTIMTEEEQQCERIFENTHTRDSEGRYIVEIPLKEKHFDFGNTKQIAERRLEQIERRLNRDTNLKQEYTRVLMEYLQLNHMEEIDIENDNTPNKFYLPHHAIIRLDKTTSKLRIVFDASCKGPTGQSLNDIMLIGPRLQQDLKHIVMRWRRHEIAFTADCVKMYRQIKVTDGSANYQRILWRVKNELKEYRLMRVTFGTASAPYLATKTLQQLAIDERQKFLLASEIAQTDFYMDDLLSGADSLDEAIEIYRQMTGLMKAGCFELQKWASNNPEFIKQVEKENYNSEEPYVMSTENVVKTLGIKWDKITDTFQYDINSPCPSKIITKRLILGEISRLFDPIGWLAPVIVKAKIIIQNLWLLKVSWDEELPNIIRTEWLDFRKELEEARHITIDRWLQTNDDDQCLELHGYSDASQMAYAAVVYVRVIKADHTIHTRLITAKTKVAPLKTISVPRLELCGAVLLTKLLQETSEVLKVPQTQIHAYTDSSIVLAWLQGHPSKWKTFIANRTSEILTTLPLITWSHVDTTKNPADVASRGATPAQLLHHKLWWTGPSELMQQTIKYTKLKDNLTELEQKKHKLKVMTLTINKEKEFNLVARYSNLTKLLRVTAYILRVFNKDRPRDIHLTGTEINAARDKIIILCQRESFEEEIEGLRKGRNVKKDSKIRTLNAFLDNKSILRVGGRLENSNLPEHTKHQIILPENHHVTRLILTDYHNKTLHGGPLLLLSNVCRKYWIIKAKKMVKQIVHQCVICTRYRATTRNQMMGSLPEARVTPCKPFLKSGVDFAGPIDLRLSKGRGCKTQKGYIAIFICMVTRAIHIEIVTSLYATDFVAAFKRFVARRGHCSDMWSDNATNLTAGNKELKSLFDKVKDNIQGNVKNLLANDGTTWHHIPAASPHFGGLWEAGVKSIKFHLRRVLGNTTLTYEELSTVTSQIEACLNSRPISPISDDPNDLQPLTPGHFLVGEAPIGVPEESYLNSKINRLTRWQFAQRVVQDFWNRWSKEYLSRLQQRPKWMTKQPNVQKGNLVLLKDENLPPSKWSLGRIVDIHPGADNLVRVVSVKCKNTIIKRPITKVCCLPTDP